MAAGEGGEGGGGGRGEKVRALETEGLFAVFVDGEDAAGLESVRRLHREFFTMMLGIGVDLNSFQSFEEDLRALPGKYATVEGGSLYLAVLAKDADEAWSRRGEEEAAVGTIAFRKHSATATELKRLFVSPKGRGRRVGEQLTRLACRDAHGAGYAEALLDTLERLPHALKTYTSLGFERTDSYIFNPQPDVVYMRRALPLE
jgi:putative acetyltransferase